MRTNCSSGSACAANSSEEELPVGFQAPGNLKLVFTVVLAVMMSLVMFSLGCSVEIRKLWSHIRRPWGIAVGLLCQFGLMPLIAYLLVISFSLQPIQAIAVLIMGCCPGGTVSNIFTFWVDGDMDLSISMTTCSTVAALGMMPLCLYLYSLSWNFEQNVTIPYQNIGISLLCLTVPVAFGVYVNYRCPKQSKTILKIGAIVGGVLLLVVTVAGVVLSRESWNPDISLLTISCIFPLIGHVAGFLLALLTHHSWQRCRTISLETGAQNIQMCLTMLQLSFTPQHCVFSHLAYKLYKRRLKNKHRKKTPGCAEGCRNKSSTSPQETGAFLEVNEELAITPGTSEPMDPPVALESMGPISSRAQ
ncbi:PREDICTED: solute carrier family 10 member 6 [Myotis davidii]|uniref:solute carrier family 10 member 6 n=1 Tax=Myotis davidii TaxID=225400 RepID=UPI0007679D82|nr:PREDICTED: solute carrier family 10 member 6 [Myotis davidii]